MRSQIVLSFTRLRFRADWLLADSSANPCSGQFRGEEAESEAEVRSIVKFLTQRASRFIAFITYHSYGERIFTRWDYSKRILPDDHGDLVRIFICLFTHEWLYAEYAWQHAQRRPRPSGAG